jgi:hypothetical protein
MVTGCKCTANLLPGHRVGVPVVVHGLPVGLHDSFICLFSGAGQQIKYSQPGNWLFGQAFKLAIFRHHPSV